MAWMKIKLNVAIRPLVCKITSIRVCIDEIKREFIQHLCGKTKHPHKESFTSFIKLSGRSIF